MVVGLLLLVTLLLVLFTYQQGRRLAHLMALEEMRVAGERIVDQFDNLLDAPIMMIVMASVSGLKLAPGNDQIAFGKQALDQLPQIDSIYTGQADGTFHQGVTLNGPSSPWREISSAPADAAYAFGWIHDDPDLGRVRTWRFQDAAGVTIGDTPPTPGTYDPRLRAWYRQALEQTGPVLSRPYRMASTNALGVTISMRQAGEPVTVVATDILLDTLADFLQRERISEHAQAYLFDPDGVLIAHSDPQAMQWVGSALDGDRALAALGEVDPMLAIVRERLSGARQEADGVVVVHGEPWLIDVRRSVGQDILAGHVVAVAAPLADFTAPSERLARDALLLSAVVIIAGVCVALLVAWRLGRSLSVLTDAARRLEDLDFLPRPIERSRVLEIITLSQTLTAARTSIHTFARYMPREIVRSIVKAGGIASSSGRRQDVTVLFTDIQDFTTICEMNDPEEVVEMLSAYFELLSASVYAHGGAIIQYLGDSIYPSWNAPTPDPDHVDHGCACAIDLVQKIQAFNLAQSRAGKPVFITRLGLHSGKAVVGSVGSSQRLQYTGMGDTVNVASRLEGLNKQFGTTILVSDAVRVRCRRPFHFRPLGEVRVKGRHEGLQVHELLAVQAGDAPAAAPVPAGGSA